MRHTPIALAAAAVLASAPAASQRQQVQIEVPPEVAARCEAAGGCALVTHQFIQAVQQQAFEAGRAAAAESKCQRTI